MAPPETAAALIIGTELLSGKIADSNLMVLARTLSGLGIRLQRAVTVLDERAAIAAEVTALAASHDVLFTSGGVGPTHDDLTIDAVADAFDVEVEPSVPIEKMLREYYGEPLSPSHLRMARIPAGADLVITSEMPWPTVVMRNVWILPGVPQIFAMKMAVVRERLAGHEAFLTLALHTRLDETDLKPALDQVVSAHPAVVIGSYPQWRQPRYRTKVTFDGRDEDALQRARQALRELLPAEAVVDVGDDAG